MEEVKLNALFEQSDLDLFQSEITRWQSAALIRLFRRINKKAGEVRRGTIEGGEAVYNLCVDKLGRIAMLLDTNYGIRAGVGPDGRSYFQDNQNGMAVALDGTRIGAN